MVGEVMSTEPPFTAEAYRALLKVNEELEAALDAKHAKLVEVADKLRACREDLEVAKSRATNERLVSDGIARQYRIASVEREEARERCQAAAHTLIAQIGAPGPEFVTDTAIRAAEIIVSLRAELAAEKAAHAGDEDFW